MSTSDEAVPECTADDVEVAVTWTERDGGLTGSVTVRNTSGRACRLSGKPGVRPVGVDGEPLEVRTVVTLEFRSPGYAVLQPGEVAEAPVSWSGWAGGAAGAEAVVSWGDPPQRVRAAVTGPRQPSSTTAGTLSSSWFSRG